MDPVFPGSFPIIVHYILYNPRILTIPQLFDLDVKECRAKFERANFNFMTMKNKKATLDVKLDDIPDAAIAAKTCDKIVVSLIVMERWRRHFEVHARSDY